MLRHLPLLALLILLLSFTGIAPSTPKADQQSSDAEVVAAAGSNFRYLPLLASAPNLDCITAEENKLIQLINAHRAAAGLPAVPATRTLTRVSRSHVRDLATNHPDQGIDSDRKLACNLHSWSANGPWSAVCYTGDHYYAAKMWSKPGELSGGVYTGNGYENAYGSSGQTTAAGAFASWAADPSHDDVIVERGIWQSYHWPAMGVGIYGGYAVLWFGDKTDPLGSAALCG